MYIWCCMMSRPQEKGLECGYNFLAGVIRKVTDWIR